MKALCTLVLLAVVLGLANAQTGTCFKEARLPEAVAISGMDMCCWYHNSTCCAINGNSANLTDFQSALNDLFNKGVSQGCYEQLANLICAFCAPGSTNFLTFTGLSGKPNNNPFDYRSYTMRLCLNYCDELASSCNNPSDAAILGAVYAPSNPTVFCESINSKALVNNRAKTSGLWENVIVRVSQFDCFDAVPINQVQQQEGVCLVSYADLLISPPNSASSFSLSFAAFAVAALVFALF